jgi:hypothetical protein
VFFGSHREDDKRMEGRGGKGRIRRGGDGSWGLAHMDPVHAVLTVAGTKVSLSQKNLFILNFSKILLEN